MKDENPSRTVPIVTLLLIGANLVVFFYEMTLSPADLQGLILSFGAVPDRFDLGQFASPGVVKIPWLTLFTSLFLHGGLLHLGGNMLYLWIFGDNVEDAVGHLRFIVFYFLCGMTASLFQVWAMPSSRVPLVGASGAIAGVLGAYLLLFPSARIQTLIIFLFFVRVVPVPALLILGLWFVMQVLSAPASGRSGIAFFAHIGGFLMGMLLIGPLLAGRRRRRA